MRKILNIVVAVITCFCVLTCSTINAFAASPDEVFLDSEGFEYKIDDKGEPYYFYPIDFHVTPINPYAIQTFAVIPDTGIEYTIEYTIEELIGTGAAAGGGIGSVASIVAASPGVVVLFSILAGCGLMYLCEPEYCETALANIWYMLSPEYQAALDSQYANPIYEIDGDTVREINKALNKAVFTSDGVTWRKALVLDTDSLTGFTDTWAETFTIVVVDTPESLASNPNFKFEQLPTDESSIIFDNDFSVSYKFDLQTTWKYREYRQYERSEVAGVYPVYYLTNNFTGASISFYPVHVGQGSMYTGRADPSVPKYVMPPIFINDGEKSGLAIPTAIGYNSSTNFVEFINHNIFNYWTGMSSHKNCPIRVFNTGSVLDDKVITNVVWNDTTQLWDYTYFEEGIEATYTISLPMEPFSWVLSQSTPSDSSGDTVLKAPQVTDETGKIVTTTTPEILKEHIGMQIPAPDKNVVVDDETGVQKETSDFTDTPPTSGSGSGSSIGNEVDTDNPDTEQLKDFIGRPFDLTGLFDWLPVEHTRLFDNSVKIVGSIVLILFVFKIISVFF